MHQYRDNFHKYLRERALVTEKEFQELKQLYSIKSYKKGERLLSKGTACKYIFFVESGLLRMYAIDEKANEHVLQFAPENWWLSDRHNLQSNHATEYFIDACEDATVALLSDQFIRKAAAVSDAFRNFHEEIMQRHIEQLYHRIAMLISVPLRDRYLEFVDVYPDIMRRVPQWMIASYLGVTAEGLSRIRKEIAAG